MKNPVIRNIIPIHGNLLWGASEYNTIIDPDSYFPPLLGDFNGDGAENNLLIREYNLPGYSNVVAIEP